MKSAHTIDEPKGEKSVANQKLKTDMMTRKLRWLYNNDYLFAKGVITKREHGSMNLAIISKYGKRR